VGGRASLNPLHPHWPAVVGIGTRWWCVSSLIGRARRPSHAHVSSSTHPPQPFKMASVWEEEKKRPQRETPRGTTRNCNAKKSGFERDAWTFDLMVYKKCCVTFLSCFLASVHVFQVNLFNKVSLQQVNYCCLFVAVFFS